MVNSPATSVSPSRRLAVCAGIAVALTVLAATLAGADAWDERLEGTLPLIPSYTLEVPDPMSGVSSVQAETGEIALRCDDQSPASRMGRINRGNWSDVRGVTLHTRVRFGAGGADTMGLQINDGIASGRIGLRYTSGSLNVRTATPDAGSPASLPLDLNQWIELWIRVFNGRYWLYIFGDSGWTLASQGIASASGGVVYMGSLSASGYGSMEVDFWRLNTDGGYDPADPAAPCVQPATSPSVAPLAAVVEPGGATQIVVSPSERNVSYQLRRGAIDVGPRVTGTGGAIYLPTGVINASSEFSVIASASTGAACSVALEQTATVLAGRPVSTIAQARAFPDGETVSLPPKPVSASAGQSYWLQEPDRSSAIRVLSGALPAPGSLRQVTGILSTADGERRILVISEAHADEGDPVTALKMRSSWAGGRAFNEHTPGVEGGIGVNTIGLLAEVWGSLTASQEALFYLDDGCALSDGTEMAGSLARGLRVLGWPEQSVAGAFNRVVGPITTFADAQGKIRPAILQTAPGCVPPATDSAVTVDNSVVCPGQATVVRVHSTESGVWYQLRKGPQLADAGAPVQGNGAVIALPTGPCTESTVFDVLATRDRSFCSARLATRPAIAVHTPPASGLHVSASHNPIDPGGSTVFTVDLSQAGVSYQLLKDGVPAGGPAGGTGGSIALPSGAVWATSQFTIRATANATGCQTILDTAITIAVNDPLAPYSKVGLHVVCGPRPGYLELLQKCSNALHPVRVIKCVDDFSPAYDAKQVNKYTLTVGRINEAGSVNLGGLDEYVGQPPAAVAAFYYSLVKPTWQANPWIDVWEACNEWSWHWAWQADFYIALMDLAEADGFKVALWSASVGNPPEEYYPDIARACARAAAHGGHMLSLHEYGLWAPPGEQYALLSNAGPYLVTRYRLLYDYLEDHNAVIPLVLTETGQEGGYSFVGTDVFMMDYIWYDLEMKKDPYVIGCAAWLLGDCGWGGVSCAPALPALGDYISTH